MRMSMFQEVEGENAILVSNGIYRQCNLYKRDESLYAKIGTGFVRLYADGSTSQAKTRLEALAYGGPVYADRLGRLTTSPTDTPIRIEDKR